MEHRDNYYENMHSTNHAPSQGEWSPPPPQFEEHDHIYTASGSPPANSLPSPYSSMPQSPQLPHSPPLHAYQQSPPQEYREGYFNSPVSTEKETPYTTHMAIGGPTPDYSAPQVVSGQQSYPFGDRSFSPSSHGGSTLMSPQPRPYTFKEHVDPNEYTSHTEPAPPPVPPKDDRKCGLKKRTFWMLIGCVLFWLIALAVGLGVGLSIGLKKNSGSDEPKPDPFCQDHPKLCVGGALNAEYLSKQGAFNGSGIALAGESWNPKSGTLFTVYFQHHSGDLRYMKYSGSQKWVGGTRAETVATDAKNATPISTVAYAANSTQFFHVFYVGQDNMIKQVTQTNESTSTQVWTQGPLSKQNLTVYGGSPSSGLQACYKGNFYGDSDFKKFPTITEEPNEIPYDNRVGMDIWYALDNSTFQQYAWYAGSPDWKEIKKWPGYNTQAGVGCYSWGAGTTQYAMMVNKDDDVEFWWKDTDTNTSTIVQDPDHPYNAWVNSSVAIPDVWPSSSLGYTTFFCAQSADRTIRGYDIQYNAENTSYPLPDNFTIGTTAGPIMALGGTHLTVTAVYAEHDSGFVLSDSLYVFFQTNGSDITAASRRIYGDEWTVAPLIIPDT